MVYQEKEELAEFYRQMNRFDWFYVTCSDMQRQPFYCTGIKMFRNNPYDIGFLRCFAVSVVPDEWISRVTVKETGEICMECRTVRYHLKPLHKRNTDSRTVYLPERLTLDDLMLPSLCDEEYRQIDSAAVLLPSCLHLLDGLSLRQKTGIKRLLDSELEGSAVSLQHCRIPAFSVSFCGNDYELLGHVFSLETRQCLTTVSLYRSLEDFAGIDPFQEFVSFARSLL